VWWKAAKLVLRGPLKLWFNWRFDGLERVPASGSMLLACNHVSYFDALALSYMMHLAGRPPRFLAKSELFRNYFLRKVLSGAGQIPVERGTGSPVPLETAARELSGGEAVIMFPEGTTTKKPDFSQQTAKTGIARLTLSTGTPVIPAAIWGSHRVWTQGNRIPAFGRPVFVKLGAPLAFADEEGSEDPEVLRRVTDEVMAVIAAQTEELKDAYPERWR
jgi:1-acyl-sn-glycerol-3-phosphate acyltransferase